MAIYTPTTPYLTLKRTLFLVILAPQLCITCFQRHSKAQVKAIEYRALQHFIDDLLQVCTPSE